MKVLLRSAVLISLGLASGMVVAANPSYVSDTGASIVRVSSGGCLRTSSWSKDNTVPECDPTQAASAPAPVEIAAVEPVMRKIELKADALFAFDSARLTDNGREQLDAVIKQMPDQASLQDKRITVTGYTDRIGTESYNKKLSEQRAQAVSDYLTSRGITEGGMDVKGLGPADPVVACKNERGNALIKCLAPNRRTTIEFSAMEAQKITK